MEPSLRSHPATTRSEQHAEPPPEFPAPSQQGLQRGMGLALRNGLIPVPQRSAIPNTCRTDAANYWSATPIEPQARPPTERPEPSRRGIQRGPGRTHGHRLIPLPRHSQRSVIPNTHSLSAVNRPELTPLEQSAELPLGFPRPTRQGFRGASALTNDRATSHKKAKVRGYPWRLPFKSPRYAVKATIA